MSFLSMMSRVITVSNFPHFFPFWRKSILNFPHGINLNLSCLQSSGTSHVPNYDPHIVHLKTRSVMHVTGKDSALFLQGLITNDIHILDASADKGPKSCYAMMLNTQGRVLYDLIIYRNVAGNYLIEYDSTLKDKFIKHLQIYKLRKDVNIVDLESSVLAVFPETVQKIPDLSPHIVCFPDPRLKMLGLRIFLMGKEISSLSAFSEGFSKADEIAYRRFRYEIGVAEGSEELPLGECFPLESNLDYLSGVHFHKGCYLGQELTARTHHTGVVRKRLMPIVIQDTTPDQIHSFKRDSIISSDQGKTVGKLRAHAGKTGIALLRISEALAAGSLQVTSNEKTSSIIVRKPNWWPVPQ